MKIMLSKALVLAVIVLFIGAGFVPSISSEISSSYAGDTLYVGGSGAGNYTSIQIAIYAANSGDTVFVYNGTYYEHISINKQIYLIGENRDTTIIDGYERGNVLMIFSNNCIIKGFSIQNGHIGIYIEKSSNNIISGNLISNNYRGIYIAGTWTEPFKRYYSKNNTISNNVISSNRGSNILIVLSPQTNIYLNNITNCRDSTSTALTIYSYSHSSLISQNNFINNNKDAVFHTSYFCSWEGNYWDRPYLSPKLIYGFHWFGPYGIPWINIDWHPAKEPYDIP